MSGKREGRALEEMRNAILDHLAYAHEHGTDRSEIGSWVWPY